MRLNDGRSHAPCRQSNCARELEHVLDLEQLGRGSQGQCDMTGDLIDFCSLEGLVLCQLLGQLDDFIRGEGI